MEVSETVLRRQFPALDVRVTQDQYGSGVHFNDKEGYRRTELLSRLGDAEAHAAEATRCILTTVYLPGRLQP